MCLGIIGFRVQGLEGLGLHFEGKAFRAFIGVGSVEGLVG